MPSLGLVIISKLHYHKKVGEVIVNAKEQWVFEVNCVLVVRFHTLEDQLFPNLVDLMSRLAR